MWCASSWTTQNSDCLGQEIIGHIHELILDDGWISAKSITQQLGISRVRVGSIIREVLDMRSSPRCGSRNAWMQIKNFNDARSLSKFGIFSAWSYGCDWDDESNNITNFGDRCRTVYLLHWLAEGIWPCKLDQINADPKEKWYRLA